MGAEIRKKKIILLSVGLFSAFLTAFLAIAVIEPEKTKEQETPVKDSVSKKIQPASSGQAGVSEGPTVVNISSLNNSRKLNNFTYLSSF